MKNPLAYLSVAIMDSTVKENQLLLEIEAALNKAPGLFRFRK